MTNNQTHSITTKILLLSIFSLFTMMCTETSPESEAITTPQTQRILEIIVSEQSDSYFTNGRKSSISSIGNNLEAESSTDSLSHIFVFIYDNSFVENVFELQKEIKLNFPNAKSSFFNQTENLSSEEDLNFHNIYALANENDYQIFYNGTSVNNDDFSLLFPNFDKEVSLYLDSNIKLKHEEALKQQLEDSNIEYTVQIFE